MYVGIRDNKHTSSVIVNAKKQILERLSIMFQGLGKSIPFREKDNNFKGEDYSTCACCEVLRTFL